MVCIDERLSAKVERAESQSAYAQRLARVLGDGSQWEYRGEVEETKGDGVCSCGHQGLRYLFPIYHPDGRRVVVGSSCIETYAGINPEMVESIQRAADEARAAHEAKIRAAKLAAQNEQVQQLAREVGAARTLLFERVGALADRQRVDYDIYRETYGPWHARNTLKLAGGALSVTIPALKTARGQITRLTKKLADYQSMIQRIPARQNW